MKRDILIIGGGVAGLSAAAQLAPHANVTLLEAESATGTHTSGRSAALFEENYGEPSTIALNRASHEFLQTFEGGFLSPRGFLLIGSPGNEVEFARDMKIMGLTEISTREALAMVPVLNTKTATRFAYADGAYDIDTDLLMQSYTRTARKHGAEIVLNARAANITRAGGKWQVNAAGRLFTADVIVNAAGAWATPVATLAGAQDITIQPLRRSVARIPAPDGHDVSAWPMLFGPDESWYAKPDAGALIVSPAEEDPVEPHDAWADDMVLAEGIARYQEVVTEEVTRMISNWAGLRSFSPDRNLVIGFDQQAEGFFWLAGQGGYGMQSSPAAGRLAADLILGRTPEIAAGVVTRLSPARFT